MGSAVREEWSQVLDRRGSDEREGHQLSSTPPRPSYSPVTPTIQPAVLAPTRHDQHQQPRPTWIEQSAAEPISLEENPDAIALKAAISILQMQREQSLKDIKALDKMKSAALQDPGGFLNELKSGGLSGSKRVIGSSEDEDDESDASQAATSTRLPFGTMPESQNIVRAPPINWAKYQIVGDSLDKLHEEQRRRPDLGEPQQLYIPELRPEHVIAGPYHPLADRLSTPPAQEHRPSTG